MEKVWYNNRTKCDSDRFCGPPCCVGIIPAIHHLERKCPLGRFLSCAGGIIIASIHSCEEVRHGRKRKKGRGSETNRRWKHTQAAYGRIRPKTGGQQSRQQTKAGRKEQQSEKETTQRGNPHIDPYFIDYCGGWRVRDLEEVRAIR